MKTKTESAIKFPKIVDQAEWQKAQRSLSGQGKSGNACARCAGRRAPAVADGQD